MTLQGLSILFIHGGGGGGQAGRGSFPKNIQHNAMKDNTMQLIQQQCKTASIGRRQESVVNTAAIQHIFILQKTRQHDQHGNNTTQCQSAEDKTARSARQQYNTASVCRRQDTTINFGKMQFCRKQDSAINTATMQHSVILQRTRQRNQHGNNATQRQSAESKTA